MQDKAEHVRQLGLSAKTHFGRSIISKMVLCDLGNAWNKWRISALLGKEQDRLLRYRLQRQLGYGTWDMA